ncbi:MAG: class II aldolase/adducin family protein [Acidobacteriota bacterium]
MPTANAPSESELRDELVWVCHKLRAAALVVALEGNVSCRVPGEEAILATPTMKDKGSLAAADIAKADMTGQPRWGGPRPSSELPAHLAVYAARADIRAIVHAHPPYATSFAVAGIALDRPLLAEAVVDLGIVPIAPYGRPGAGQLAAAIADLAKSHDVVLMANHGAICLGTTLREAFYRMETLEHYAQIALLTRILGGSTALSCAEVEDLLRAQGRAREKVEGLLAEIPGCPVPAGSGAGTSSGAGSGAREYRFTREELIALMADAMCYKDDPR